MNLHAANSPLRISWIAIEISTWIFPGVGLTLTHTHTVIHRYVKAFLLSTYSKTCSMSLINFYVCLFTKRLTAFVDKLAFLWEHFYYEWHACHHHRLRGERDDLWALYLQFTIDYWYNYFKSYCLIENHFSLTTQWNSFIYGNEQFPLRLKLFFQNVLEGFQGIIEIFKLHTNKRQ